MVRGIRKSLEFISHGGVIEQFKDDLKGYTISKGTIQFPLDNPIPTALIRKLLKARVAGA